jgi:uncharacterized protein YecA (UPF0149 family)
MEPAPILDELNGPEGLPREALFERQISAPPAKNIFGKVGRNEPCPCGSGTKYKNCCLQ